MGLCKPLPLHAEVLTACVVQSTTTASSSWVQLSCHAHRRHFPLSLMKIHMKELNWSCLTQGNATTEAIHHQIKSPVSGVGHLPLICWLEVSQRSPKQCRLLPLFLLTHQNSIWRPYCWRHHILWPQDVGKQGQCWTGNFFLAIWLYSTGKWCAGHGRKSTPVLPSCEPNVLQ